MPKNNLRISVKGFESGPFHWCPATVQGAMGTTKTQEGPADYEDKILYRSKPCKRLLIEAVEFPSLEIFKTHLDVILCNLPYVSPVYQRIWT